MICRVEKASNKLGLYRVNIGLIDIDRGQHSPVGAGNIELCGDQ